MFLFKYNSPSGENESVAFKGTVDPDLGEEIFFAKQVLRILNFGNGRSCKMRAEPKLFSLLS